MFAYGFPHDIPRISQSGAGWVLAGKHTAGRKEMNKQRICCKKTDSICIKERSRIGIVVCGAYAAKKMKEEFQGEMK